VSDNVMMYKLIQTF